MSKTKKKNPAAGTLAKLRAKSLSPERCAEIAREGSGAAEGGVSGQTTGDCEEGSGGEVAEVAEGVDTVHE